MSFTREHLFEVSLFLIIFLTFICYVFFVKVTSKRSTVYVETSIQKGDFYQQSPISVHIFDGVKINDQSPDKLIKITGLFLFLEKKDWQLSDESSYIGRVRFAITATKNNGNYFYKEQELLAGNPMTVDIDNRKLDLIITRVQDKDFDDSGYQYKTITVKIYSKRLESIDKFHKDLEFKDGNGKVYAKILDVQRAPSPMVTVDQLGNSYLKDDPLNYDVSIELQVLAKQEGSLLNAYDGRKLALDERFFFNDPFFINTYAYILNIQ